MPEAPNKQIFVIVGIKNALAIQTKLHELGAPTLALKDDVWLAVYGGTTRDFAEALGIRKGEIGASGLVVPVENYSGRASNEVWEWLKVNWPRNDYAR